MNKARHLLLATCGADDADSMNAVVTVGLEALLFSATGTHPRRRGPVRGAPLMRPEVYRRSRRETGSSPAARLATWPGLGWGA